MLKKKPFPDGRRTEQGGSAGRFMPQPSKVEFPGQKQRMRMRGTKQANLDTQKRLRKNLDKLLDEGESLLPAMTWTGKLKWGRVDPVTKTLAELRKILLKRNDLKFLSKRMMAKRGDPVGKALAGSLIAAHEKEISIVGDYKHPSFGNASFVRKGDGKVMYLAGIQNHHMPTMRMLPWEDHAKRGYFFFSWNGGFVCSGPEAKLPDGWLADVLSRSRFNFDNKDGVWATKGLDIDAVADNQMAGKGYLLLNFINGNKVAIGFENLSKNVGKTSFIHDLALSMLPPNLSNVMTPDAIWYPEGVEKSEANESIERILDAWMGLTLDEGSIGKRVKLAVINHIPSGFVVGEKWFEEVDSAVNELNGSSLEKKLATHMMKLAENSGLRIGQGGKSSERKGEALEVASNSCNDVLSALWDDYGKEGLLNIGIDEEMAEDLWQSQSKKKRAFGKFLKDIQDKISKADVLNKFPYRQGELPGPVGTINDLTIIGLVDGMGKAEKLAMSKHKDIDSESAAWAWLLASNKAAGQEWHFSPNARERGSAWSAAATVVWNSGKAIVNDEDVDYKLSLENLRKAAGQIESLP